MLVTGDALHRVPLTERVTVRAGQRDHRGEWPRFRIMRYEATVLICAAIVQGHISPKDGTLWYLELTVPLQNYFRVIKGVRSPESPSGITRAKQNRGAKKWVVRLDRARPGKPFDDRTVFLGPLPDGNADRQAAIEKALSVA